MTKVATTFDVSMLQSATTDTPMRLFDLETRIVASAETARDELAMWRLSAAEAFWRFEDSLPETE